MKNMLCVKSIMTICLTIMLCVMVYLRPDDYGDVFKNIVVMVATFYFSYQSKKAGAEDGKPKSNSRDDTSSNSDSNSDGGVKNAERD